MLRFLIVVCAIALSTGSLAAEPTSKQHFGESSELRQAHADGRRIGSQTVEVKLSADGPLPDTNSAVVPLGDLLRPPGDNPVVVEVMTQSKKFVKPFVRRPDGRMLELSTGPKPGGVYGSYFALEDGAELILQSNWKPKVSVAVWTAYGAPKPKPVAKPAPAPRPDRPAVLTLGPRLLRGELTDADVDPRDGMAVDNHAFRVRAGQTFSVWAHADPTVLQVIYKGPDEAKPEVLFQNAGYTLHVYEGTPSRSGLFILSVTHNPRGTPEMVRGPYEILFATPMDGDLCAQLDAKDMDNTWDVEGLGVGTTPGRPLILYHPRYLPGFEQCHTSPAASVVCTVHRDVGPDATGFFERLQAEFRACHDGWTVSPLEVKYQTLGGLSAERDGHRRRIELKSTTPRLTNADELPAGIRDRAKNAGWFVEYKEKGRIPDDFQPEWQDQVIVYVTVSNPNTPLRPPTAP